MKKRAKLNKTWTERAEEIGKLLELLNEYEAKLEEMPLTRRRWREERGILYRRFMNAEDAERMVISKSFGFIKWLVENEKIKEDEYQYIGTDDEQYTYSKYENLLMKLSILDNPIEFLVSILK